MKSFFKPVIIAKAAKIANLATIAILAIMLSSCEHKELCYVHPHATRIKVVYDWSEAPEALEAMPKGMCAFFYSEDKPGYYYRFDFPGAKEGYVELPEGRYVLITYNNDTEAVKFSTVHSFDGHFAYTRNGDILEPMYGNGVSSSVRGDDDERVVITPDELWGCQATEIEITDHGVTYVFTRAGEDGAEITTTETGDQVITLYPHDMLCHYSYEVQNVPNIKHVTNVSGAISGMSGQLMMSNEKLHTEPITLPVYAQPHIEDNTIRGEFLTFGHHEDIDNPHRMSFYVAMDDGSKYSFKTGDHLDVTDQVHSAPNRRRVHLIIKKLDIPTPIANGNGFKPDVDSWGVIEEDIIL